MSSTGGQLIRPRLEELLLAWPGAQVPSSAPGRGPDDLAHFGVHATIYIAAENRPELSLFDAVVCTPSWLAASYDQKVLPRELDWIDVDADFAAGLILMRTWNHDKLRRLLENLCEESGASTWIDVSQKIARALQWEFD